MLWDKRAYQEAWLRSLHYWNFSSERGKGKIHCRSYWVTVEESCAASIRHTCRLNARLMKTNSVKILLFLNQGCWWFYLDGLKQLSSFSTQLSIHSVVIYPASILYKSIAGRYRPVSYPDGPITARYRFIKNAYWVYCHIRDIPRLKTNCETNKLGGRAYEWLSFENQ